MWSSKCQLAFENVKTLLCAALVLAAPCLDEPFKLQVDAGHVAAGTVLLQENEGVDRPVCYFPKKFNSHQLNYSRRKRKP